ncbi:hypothetical protein C8R45DRAFT_921101 [Mycena sanguinolenta]|nr:hypothetical protein C8R45DRAFT_921101 [Mycena sanguinolenta]
MCKPGKVIPELWPLSGSIEAGKAIELRAKEYENCCKSCVMCTSQHGQTSASFSFAEQTFSDGTLALRLMGEMRVGWSFAKSEKHTTHTQHTHNTHNIRRCVRSRNKEKLFCYSVQKRLSSLSSISQYLLAKRSKDFNSRKVKVLVSKSYITRAETVN